MNRILSAALLGLFASSTLWANYLSPESLVLSQDGQRLLIGERRGCKVSERTLEGAELRTFSKTIKHGGFLGFFAKGAPAEVLGVTYAPDGTVYYTIENGNEGELVRQDGTAVVTGNGPMTPVVSKDGKYIYVANRYSANVVKVDASTMKVVATAPTTRDTTGCALGADDKLLFAINLLPTDATEPTGWVAAAVTVIDASTFKVVNNVKLPDGSTGVRGIVASPEGDAIYVTHTQARYQLPTTQLERGWMNTAALSIFDGKTGAYINTVLLDDVDLGGANPWGVSVTPDGKSIAVSHAGTREVSVIDRAKLHKQLEDAAAGKRVTEVTQSSAEVHNDLSFLSGIRRRFDFTVDGPRGVVATNDKVFTVCYFADALVEIPFKNRVVKPVIRPLNGTIVDLSKDRVLRGEMLFNDGSMCFQQWQSCATCHPDGIVDGLNWDLLNDGIGNPKQTKSLYLSGVTPPTMITGIRANMEHCNRAGIRHIQFCTRPEEDGLCLDAYVLQMKAQTSPFLTKENKKSIARGKKLFNGKADCSRCHMPDHYFTAALDPKDAKKSELYDVGLGIRSELGRKFDVPTLHEVWRTAPYLYDGRAKTMHEVLTKYNPADQHGLTSDLTEQELQDLENYVMSL